MKVILCLFSSFLALTYGGLGLMAEGSDTLLRDALFAEEAQQDHATAIQKYTILLSQYEKERKIAVVALFRMAEIHRKEGRGKQAATFYRRLLTEFPGMEPQNRMSLERLAALGEKLPALAKSGVQAIDDESKELVRLQKLESTSPDLFRQKTHLRKAIDHGWMKVATYLLSKGAEINQPGVLSDSVADGNLAMVKFLITHGCAPTAKEKATALHLAANNGYSNIFDYLIKQEYKIEKPFSLSFIDLVHKKYPLEVLKKVVDAGCDINAIGEWDFFPYFNSKPFNPFNAGFLHAAISQGRDDIVTYLIQQKVNVNLVEPTKGITPLHLAIWRGNATYVSQLLKAGADVNLYPNPSKANRSFAGKSALPLALELKRFKIGKLLLQSKNLPAHLISALYSASAQGKADWVTLLLDHGVDPNTKSNPLKAALENKHFKIADLLMAKGAKLQEKDIPYAPFKLRTQWMREHRYSDFAKRAGITLVLPEKPWDAEFLQSSDTMSASDVASVLYQMVIPNSLKDVFSDDPFGAAGTLKLHEMDHMTCILIRQGKQLPYNFNAKELPDLEPGDILEWTSFQTLDEKRANHYNRISRGNRRVNTMKLSSTALGPQIRRHIRVPIEVNINGKKESLTLNGGLAVYDPRTRDLPLEPLNAVLKRIGIHPFNGDVKIQVHRKGWQPLHFSLNDRNTKRFYLQAGDRIEVAMPTESDSKFPNSNSVLVTVPGTLYHSSIPTNPNALPTLLQALTHLIHGRNLTKENNFSSGNSTEWIETLRHPEKLDTYLIRQRKFQTNLYNIDLTKIVIRRYVRNNKREWQRTVIPINLQKIITDWDGTEESAKKSDVTLQVADVIELQLLSGPLTDWTPRQKQMIEVALSYKMMFSEGGNAIEPKTVAYHFPEWISTRAGLIPLHRGNDITSLNGSGWISGQWVVCQRGGVTLNVPTIQYWPRDGDQMTIQGRVKHAPPVPKN